MQLHCSLAGLFPKLSEKTATLLLDSQGICRVSRRCAVRG